MIDFSILDSHPLVLGIFAFFFGALYASFAGMLVYRLPQICKIDYTEWARNLGGCDTSIGGRSHCDHCNRQLNWIDLIPIFGWLIARGRCKQCGNRVSWMWPAVEALSGLLMTIIWLSHFSLHSRFVLSGFMMIGLLALWLDSRTLWLPDWLTLPLLFGGLEYGHGWVMSRVDGAGAGFLIMTFALGLLSWLKRSDFMNWADVILFSAMGAWVGVDHIVCLMSYTCGIGFLHILVLKVFETRGGKIEKHENDIGSQIMLPFGPAMIISGFGITYIYF